MNPLRSILPATRAGIQRISRRDFLLAAGGAVVGSVAGQGILDPVLEPVAEPVRETLYGVQDPVPHMRAELGMREFERLASDGQRAAREALAVGVSVPDLAAGRCSIVEERDGDMWVVSQGKEAGAILWGRPVVGRMADRPDRMFGRWRAECVRAAGLRSEPTFELIRAIANGRPHRYTALVIPGKRITIVTAPEPATPPPAARSTPQTTPRYT